MKILAIIPARGGSKGISRKNLVKVAGKPLIQYTLDIVNELAGLVIPFVSTDDQEISNYCSAQGFDMSYRRPANLAQDNSSCIDVVLDALSWYKAFRSSDVEAVLLLQPTSPLRFVTELKLAIEKFQAHCLSSLISVMPLREHPYECLEVQDEGWVYLRNPSKMATARQQYANNFYFIDGSFYLASTVFLNQYKVFVKENITQLFYLDRTWPIDIDIPDDLLVAEAFLRVRKN